MALILGSEGQGVSLQAMSHSHPVSIPMVGDAESLNVSQAGAILMFMLSKGFKELAGQLQHGWAETDS